MTFCWNFMDENPFYWVFSTLAQVFGALLALLGVFMIFKLGKIEFLKDAFSNAKTAEIQSAAEKSEREFIEKAVFTLSTTAFVVIYSILILPFSYYLINNLLVAFLLMMVCGITVPIIVLIVIVFFIKMSLSKNVSIKSICSRWKFWEW
jgi:hypothetical protein